MTTPIHAPSALVSADAPQEWRVVDTGGVVRSICVHPRRPDWIAAVDGPGYRASMGSEDEWGSTPHLACLRLAEALGIEAVEIRAPGDETTAEALAAAAQAHAPSASPDLAAIAQRHAAAARVERHALPAEVLAALADVPVLLRALAPQPAPDAPDVAAIGARAAAATEGPWRIGRSYTRAGSNDGGPFGPGVLVPGYPPGRCSRCRGEADPCALTETVDGRVWHILYADDPDRWETVTSDATHAEVVGSYGDDGVFSPADAEFIAHARTDVPALLAWIAAEPARTAAAVAAERARGAALRNAASDLVETLSQREDACRVSAKDSLSGEVRSRLMGKTSAYGHAAELLTRVLIDADALAAPAGGVG